MKILITDPIEQSCIEILQREGFTVDVKTGLPPEEIKKIISEYTAMIVRSGTQVTADIIECATSMKIIGRAGAGVDNIDVKAASRKGIIVMNTPGGNTLSTAEHTMSLMLSLARRIPQAHISMQAGKWERKKFMGTELFGKTLGIVGLGKIGREVATRSQSFGMNIIGFDPVLANDIASKMNIELVSLDELYRRSDIITVHTPLTEETKSLLNEKTIAQCKKGVRLINCARGGIIDETALLNALNSGHVAGAALDVFSIEPPPKENLLLQHPNIVLTPHLGASTEEAQEKVAIQIAEQLADALHNRGIVGAVNAAALQSGIPNEIQPFVTLAQKLGKLQAQLLKGTLKEITITLQGEMLYKYRELLQASVLQGLFSQLMSEPVNYINAPFIAQTLGIHINEKKEIAGENFTHLLVVEYKTENEQRTFAGTVFGNKPRIVRIDNFHFEIHPEGMFLFYNNIDKPGMLAKVGSLLAEANVNIAGLMLGRTEVGKHALTVINIDSKISQSILEKITKFDGVFDAKVVEL